MVQYQSSNLELTLPELAHGVDGKALEKVAGIRKAHELAESVREKFKKRTKKERDEAKLNAVAVSEDADKAVRYDRRLQMNRQSAAASRVRREAYIKALEKVLVEEDAKHKQLEAELLAERTANKKLVGELTAARSTASGSVQSQVTARVSPLGASSSSISVVELEVASCQALSPNMQLIDEIMENGAVAPVNWNGVGANVECGGKGETVFDGLEDFVDIENFQFTPTDPVDPLATLDDLLNI